MKVEYYLWNKIPPFGGFFLLKKIFIPAFFPCHSCTPLVIPAKAGMGSIQCAVKRSQIYKIMCLKILRCIWCAGRTVGGPYPCLRRDDKKERRDDTTSLKLRGAGKKGGD